MHLCIIHPRKKSIVLLFQAKHIIQLVIAHTIATVKILLLLYMKSRDRLWISGSDLLYWNRGKNRKINVDNLLSNIVKLSSARTRQRAASMCSYDSYVFIFLFPFSSLVSYDCYQESSGINDGSWRNQQRSSNNNRGLCGCRPRNSNNNANCEKMGSYKSFIIQRDFGWYIELFLWRLNPNCTCAHFNF